MDILVLRLIFFTLMLIGGPIGTSLGISAVMTIFRFDLDIGMVGINFSSSIASFPLLAVPFFILVNINLFAAANLIGGDVDGVPKQAIPFVLMVILILVILLYRSCRYTSDWPEGHPHLYRLDLIHHFVRIQDIIDSPILKFNFINH
jgi:hypothetical protein